MTTATTERATEADFHLVESLSIVSRWSRLDEFAEVLTEV